MTQRPRAVISWSGGKDSALALHDVVSDGILDVAGLLTTVTDDYDRISMHGVRTSLLRAQASALRLPLFEVRIPARCSNADYEAAFLDRLESLRAEGIHDIVFGDLFLEDIRSYREDMLKPTRMIPHFPLWARDTRELALQFVEDGFAAALVCVDPHQLAASFCGRDFDSALLADLPTSCDPCGERGEFHTFVYDAPLMEHPIPIRRGQIVERDGFVFCDIQNAQVSPASLYRSR